MLSIDEAIAHAKEVASRKFDDRVHCIRCAEEHEQLAEWLEELKAYRAIGTPEECRAAVEKKKEMIAYCDENDCSDCPYHSGNLKENRCMNDFIAEQLKVGVDNEQID